MSRNKSLISILFLIVLLILVIFLAIISGSGGLTIDQTLKSLLHPGSEGINSDIIWKIRLPRIFLSVFVGMGLSASGCVFQNILKNPLAEPYTLGISGGAAFGTSLGIITGLGAASMFLLPLSAFAGALISILLVFFISAKKRFSNQIMILSGVILGFVFSALVLLIFSFGSAEKIQSAMMWLMGDLSSGETPLIVMAGLAVFAGISGISIFSRELDAIILGDEKALSLGINISLIKGIYFTIVSLITAVCVSVSGIIGFVGLIIPHVVKKFSNPAHAILIPSCALAGAIFLTLCDTLARTIVSPLELPVGVITGLFGGVFLLVFLFNSDKRGF